MSFRDFFCTSEDGLRLYGRDYGGGGRTPVLCLPGLTRNARDFETLAPRLSNERRVVAIDYRGRGRSQYAPDPMTYRPEVEASDTLAVLDHLSIARAAVVGTSRGGIVAMVMAARALARLAGVAFNDIGPRIDKVGLLRIRSYLGETPSFRDWAEAVAAVKERNPGFDGLGEDQWLAFARRVFRDEGGEPRLDYDPRLGEAFPSLADIEQDKVPELWGLFDLLAPLPLLVLRGENSDLLGAATVAEMAARHPGFMAVTVAGRGHVPFLDEPESIAALDRWLAAVDAG
jgi:pimeloyl-ACP methyl ester carboxylesterase